MLDQSKNVSRNLMDELEEISNVPKWMKDFLLHLGKEWVLHTDIAKDYFSSTPENIDTLNAHIVLFWYIVKQTDQWHFFLESIKWVKKQETLIPDSIAVLQAIINASQNDILKSQIDFSNLTIWGIEYEQHEFVAQVSQRISSLLQWDIAPTQTDDSDSWEDQEDENPTVNNALPEESSVPRDWITIPDDIDMMSRPGRKLKLLYQANLWAVISVDEIVRITWLEKEKILKTNANLVQNFFKSLWYKILGLQKIKATAFVCCREAEFEAIKEAYEAKQRADALSAYASNTRDSAASIGDWENTPESPKEQWEVSQDISGSNFRMSLARAGEICSKNPDFDIESYTFSGVELEKDEFIFCLLCAENTEVGIDESEIRENLRESVVLSWRDFLLMRSCITDKIRSTDYEFSIEDTSIVLRSNAPKVESKETKQEGAEVDENTQKSKVVQIVIWRKNATALLEKYPNLNVDLELWQINEVQLDQWPLNLFLYCLERNWAKSTYWDIYKKFTKKDLDSSKTGWVAKSFEAFIDSINTALGSAHTDLHISQDQEYVWMWNIEDDVEKQWGTDTSFQGAESPQDTRAEGQKNISRFEEYIEELWQAANYNIELEVTWVDTSKAPLVWFLVWEEVIEIPFTQVEYAFFWYFLSENGRSFTISSLYERFSTDNPLKSSAEFGHFYTEIKNSINAKLRSQQLEENYWIKSPNNKESVSAIYEQYDKWTYMFMYNRITHELRWWNEIIILSDENVRIKTLRFLRTNKIALTLKVANAEMARSIQTGFDAYNLPFSVSIEWIVTLKK